MPFIVVRLQVLAAFVDGIITLGLPEIVCDESDIDIMPSFEQTSTKWGCHLICVSSFLSVLCLCAWNQIMCI